MISWNLPKISCLLLTTGRRGKVERSLRCYLEQTYSVKELIILSKGEPDFNEYIKSYVQSFDRDDIIVVTCPSRNTLGLMRNLASEIATGEVLCQWDDDDLYHPDRLLSQYKALRSSPSVVASAYVEHLKLFENTGDLYWLKLDDGTDDYRDVLNHSPYKRYLAGSVMFHKSAYHEGNKPFYPQSGSQSKREEDLNVLQKLMQLGKIADCRNAYEYVYTFHGGNVYEEHHHLMCFHKKAIGNPSELEHNKSQILKTLETSGVTYAKICTSELVNFDVPGAALTPSIIYEWNNEIQR